MPATVRDNIRDGHWTFRAHTLPNGAISPLGETQGPVGDHGRGS